MPTDPVIVLLGAHQTKYLDLVYAGLARQTRKPDLIVTSCDTDVPEIGEIARVWAPLVGVPIAWVRRKHHGIARLNQVRNNAARYVIDDLGLTRGRLIQLDADMIATPTLVERHVEFGRTAELVYPHRVNLTREESESLDARRVLAGEQMPALSQDAAAELAQRQRRYRRHLIYRRLGLAPLHKPKLLGGNWSASIELWRAINGFDEHFQGWGFDDDEFARRAARAGARCAIAVNDIIAYHLWHPTRQPSGRMSDNPNHPRFVRKDLPIAADRGLRNPIEQHPVSVMRFEPRIASLRRFRQVLPRGSPGEDDGSGCAR